MRTRRRINFGPLMLSMLVLLVIVVSGWAFRHELAQFSQSHPAVFPSAVIFIAFILIGIAAVLWLEAEYLRRVWRRRVATAVGLDNLRPESVWRLVGKRLPDPLDWVMRPLWGTRIGKQLFEDWIDAELGGKASRYGMLLLATALFAYLFGLRIGGPVLGVALALIAPLLPRSLVASRAEARRRRFSEQLPQALDAVASGLAAGLSFQQAIEYAREDLPVPAHNAFTTLARRIALGFPVDEALQKMLKLYPDESLALVVDGIVLQRQFGGDMVRMLEDIAGVLRERLELEREVRAITTQGRLSGIIIAALVPVSAGFLLAFNPRYVDVLFETLVGQVMIVLAILMQLVGWAIISRLVQIRY